MLTSKSGRVRTESSEEVFHRYFRLKERLPGRKSSSESSESTRMPRGFLAGGGFEVDLDDFPRAEGLAEVAGVARTMLTSSLSLSLSAATAASRATVKITELFIIDTNRSFKPQNTRDLYEIPKDGEWRRLRH